MEAFLVFVCFIAVGFVSAAILYVFVMSKLYADGTDGAVVAEGESNDEIYNEYDDDEGCMDWDLEDAWLAGDPNVSYDGTKYVMNEIEVADEDIEYI